MDKTRAGENVSAQIARMGKVEGLSKGNFALPDGYNFQIKNDGIQPVTLQVRLARMEQGGIYRDHLQRWLESGNRERNQGNIVVGY